MSVTVVVGGQFGSEGKGKVAHYFAKVMNASVSIRCGGPNSGHKVIDPFGNTIIFQQLPTASILPDISIVLCAGMYIDLDILLREIEIAKLSKNRLFIDPNAVIITPDIKQVERECGLINFIGSTGSGTGEAVVRRTQRYKGITFAKDATILSKYIKDTRVLLRNHINKKHRVILEGTQGFGLSLLHSPFYPYVTSRDTTASGFVSEAGLSPLDIDQIILTIRAFPIRVGGNSGPLSNETNWDAISAEGHHNKKIEEKTTVTKRIRRVAKFSPDIVCEAINVNNPTDIVLNHVDYLCCLGASNRSRIIEDFVNQVEVSIKRKIDYLGLGPEHIQKMSIDDVRTWK